MEVEIFSFKQFSLYFSFCADKLEEPLEAEDADEDEDDADSTVLQGEIGAALRALERDAGDKDSDNESDKSRSVEF